jgi:hypothetical protein
LNFLKQISFSTVNLFPAMLRKIRPMPNGVRTTPAAVGTEKPTSGNVRELTTEQKKVALHLATTFNGSQRKDLDILERMIKKRAEQQKTAKDTKAALVTTTAGSCSKKSAAPQTRNDDDWEARALTGIAKKGLSLDRQWTESTWQNKSSIYERLKLLKDDGVDVGSLRAPRTSSEAVTQAVLARVATRMKRRPALQSDPHSKASFCKRTDAPRDEEGKASPAPDLTFAHHSYRPLPTPPLRRKRASAADTSSSETAYLPYASDEDEPLLKKRCMLNIRTSDQSAISVTAAQMPEETAPTFDLLKRLVLLDIFKPFQNSDRRKFRRPTKIIIALASEMFDEQHADDLELSASGYGSMKEELQVLSETLGGSADKMIIRDPTTPSYADFMRVSDSEQQTVLEGDAYMLEGLLARWQAKGKGLLHFDRRNCFDEAGNRTRTFFPFEFSDKTQEQLAKIQQALARDMDDGTVLHVKVVDISTATPKVDG